MSSWDFAVWDDAPLGGEVERRPVHRPGTRRVVTAVGVGAGRWCSASSDLCTAKCQVRRRGVWDGANRNPSESHHLLMEIGLTPGAVAIVTTRSRRGVLRHLFTGIGLPPGAVAIVTTGSREGIIALSLYRYLTCAWRSCNRYNLFARGVLHHLFTGIGLIPGAGVIVTTCSRKGVLRHLFTEIGLTRGAGPQPSFRPSSNTSRSAPFLSASL